MNKKLVSLISVFLAFVMIFSMIPMVAYASGESNGGLNSFSGTYAVNTNDVYKYFDSDLHVSQLTTTEIAPGIKGTDVCYYDVNNNEQVAGYMTTVDLSQGNVKIKATYKGFYNGTDSTKWGIQKWGMQTLSDQAAAYEASTGEKVVAATNGDYFNMQTGQPLGVLIMNGVNCNPDKTAAEPYFAILKDGTAVIRDKGTPVNDVEEAISSPFYLVKNGVNVVGSVSELIPGNSIGIDKNGNVILFLADGRQEPYSRGLSIYELAEFWIAQGVDNVLYLDGGGSATSLSTAADGKTLTLRNSPSDGYERTVSSGLLFISTAPAYSGEFDHATIYTTDDSYAAGAIVEFKASCVDTTGHNMNVPAEWKLDSGSTGLGSIDKATGVFSSNGIPGTVTVNLLISGKTVASKTVAIKESDNIDNYTGFISNEAGKKYIVNGETITGWFTIGKELYHSGSDGIVHKATTTDTRTCLDNGRYQGNCECGATYSGQALWSLGHDWDENHVCTRCGEQGIDINNISVPATKFYTYQGKAVTPNVNFLTYEGRTLTIRSSRKGTDGYVSYYNNTSVGVAQMTIEGRGNFYGTLCVDYYITPGPVTGVACKNVTADSATLYWNTASGATQYMVEQKINGEWKTVGRVGNTTYELRDLSPNTNYEYRVTWEATIDNRIYRANVNSRPAVSFTTKQTVNDIFCTIERGQTIKASHIDGNNYIFLPSGTDISSLSLYTSDKTAVTIVGNKGSVTTETTFDLADISSKTDGYYSVTVSSDTNQCTARIMVSDTVPSIFLTSSDAENEGRAYVDAVKGNSTTGNMLMLDADGSTVIYNGELTQIKSRGNSSFVYSPKKAYQIKLDSKSDILGNGENGKTWVLLANYMDATAMRDKLFKDLAAKMGMLGSPDCEWVDLYYDGEYRGTYLVSEKASIGKTTVAITDMEDAYDAVNENYGDDTVTNTDKNAYGNNYYYTEGLVEPEDITGGYLLEVNAKRGVDEASGFKTTKGYDINVKSPEYAGKSAMIYISEYFQAFENAVYAQDAEGKYTGYNTETGKYFYEYCDLDSLVKMYLLQSTAANPDAFYASLYFYKDAGKIMHIGPMWDMDLSLGAGMEADISAKNGYINSFRYLAEALIQIPEFQKAVKEYFNSDFKAYIQELIGSGIDKYAATVDASVSMNHVLWPYVRSGNPNSETHFYDESVTYETIISNTKTWLNTRLVYLEGIVNHEHSYKLSESTGTCTESGQTTYACSICGAKYSIAYPEGLGHDFGEWKVTKAATCAEKGVETRSCSRCEATETREIAALGHRFGEWRVTTAPTCTEKGVETSNCSRCDATETREIAALGHDFGEWTVTMAPTCTEKGVETSNCSRCEAAETREVKALGHEIVHHDGKAATCTTEGYTGDKVCAVCNTVVEQGKVIAALGHDFGEWKVTTAATCTEKGVENRNCSRCEADETREVEALGHELVHHDGKAATCTEKGWEAYDACTHCDYTTYKEIAALGHEYKNGKCVLCGELNNPFTDIGDLKQELQESILWAYYHEPQQITSGFTATEFRPNNDCTRAQVVTFLWRAAGCPEPESSNNPFVDVQAIQANGEANPYYTAILWAAEQGITTGFDATHFKPNDTVTRAQFVTFLWRYEGEPEAKGSTDTLKDSASIAAPYQEAVAWGLENEIITGYEDETFRPNNVCKRWAVTVLMQRALGDAEE